MITRRPLFYWVKTSNWKLQILLLILIAIGVATRVFPLEMQKRIVNQAIGLGRVNLLFLYCGLYLAAVILASGIKFVINVIQTHLGQQTLARLRKELYAHILTLPMGFFRRTSSGMVVSSLVTEVVSAGEMVGQAIAVPVNNILTLLAFTGYMFYLNPLLAGLSLVIYPLILFSIPALQRRANIENKNRVDATRTMSSKIGETISGIHEVHGNGSYHIENRRFAEIVDLLYRIRVRWNVYRYAIKVLNNLFQNMGPFMLFIVGGYLAISGRFDLGALVAFLSAYEKLYDPWRELMDYYQTYQEASVSYRRLMEYFDDQPEFALSPPDRPPYELAASVQVRDLSFSVAPRVHLLQKVSFDLEPGESMALVGFSGSGKSTLVHCIGQLYRYTGGSVQIGGREVHELTKQDLVRNAGIVAQTPYIFDGTIRENLLYACQAIHDPEDEDARKKLPSLDEMIEVIQQVGLFVDVLRFGLNTVIGEEEGQELHEKLIRMRYGFQSEFGEVLADDIEFFDIKRYMLYSSVAANLTFGTALRQAFDPETLSINEYFLWFLDKADLKGPLLELGRDATLQTMDILGNIEPDALFFEQSPMEPDEFDEYRELSQRLVSSGIDELSSADRAMLLRLALRFVVGSHMTGELHPGLQDALVRARKQFRDQVQADHPDAFSFYRMSGYLPTLSILDNILFGRIRADLPGAQERIAQSLMQLLIEEDLLERIVEIGMDFRVGPKGDRLSGGQRQKLAIARTFLKHSPLLILDEATSALDNASQKRIQSVLETRWKGRSTIIAVAHRLDTIRNYDKIAVMKAGRIVEMGAFEELLERKGILYELVHGVKADL
ncbi:MAG: ABC transporter ATP-binding protein/permease [Syntrophobacteraceae bacterium]|jgi:ABC-type multidrug transport system fused ATPase/permease subunit|nr:ABC transporter ATP-binding protein/permease [Syntrophobacteraceae bacterium]